jgi:guanine nucleotide exchange factor VAV
MAQFLCLKNIRAFLHACSGVFGIKETDLFQPSMLYDYSDFARVVHTLSRLSNCPKARSRISGFPVQSGTLAGASASHEDDQVQWDQIWRKLGYNSIESCIIGINFV